MTFIQSIVPENYEKEKLPFNLSRTNQKQKKGNSPININLLLYKQGL